MTPTTTARKKTRLSSDSVSMYRVFAVVLGVTASMMAVVVAFFVIMDPTPDWGSYLPFFGVVGILDLTAWFGFRNWKDVFFDDQFLYVETTFKKEKYELKNVRRLNGCYSTRDGFEIEFHYERGSILKIDYFPPRSERFHYALRDEFSGRSLAFNKMLKEINQHKVSN